MDHIDGNPLNNSIANLRDVSKSVNLQNRRRAKRKHVRISWG
ncbi:MAG: HNH endonuclease [Candidatus Accumulibacter sp.]|nr:HNH endonuclease [Accumulibacter sp.]